MKPSPTDNVQKMPIEALIPYARNSRTHSDEQVAQIAASIKEWGFTTPVLVDESGQIIAGHGRVMAARKLALSEVPVLIASGWTDAQKRAYVIADNKLALNAGWDQELLLAEFQELKESGFNIDLTGFDETELNDLLNDQQVTESELYTAKIEAPTYKPKGKKPAIAELFNQTRSQELAQKINESSIPDDEKQFLITAAQRHTIFDFGKIAEYYCHSSPEVQALMEDSALVIIDFKKAIANGYVKLSKAIDDQCAEDYDE